MINIGELIAEHGIGKRIGEGNFGEVYRIGRTNYAIKIGRDCGKPENKRAIADKFEHEFGIAKALYALNVSVPMPIGFTGVRNPKTGEFSPGLVMGFVDGLNLFQITEKGLREKTARLRDREILDARRFGFHPVDHLYPGNVLYAQTNDRAYLIDFQAWRSKQDD